MFKAGTILVVNDAADVVCVDYTVGPIPGYGWLIATKEGNYCVVQKHSSITVDVLFLTSVPHIKEALKIAKSTDVHTW